MRRLAVCLLILSAPAGANELATSATHEVTQVPAPPAPLRGPRFAPITVELYVAFGHPSSVAASELSKKVVARGRENEVRTLVHVFPFGAPGSDLAAEAAVEAELQGKFFALADKLLAPGPRFGTTLPELVRVARDVGLDGSRLEQALAQRTHRATVEARAQVLRAANHSPGQVFLNGKSLQIYISEENFRNELRSARARADALLEAGVPLQRVYERLLEEADESARESSRLPKRRVRWPEDRSPARGPALAPLQVVVFSNLAAPACASLHWMLRALRARYPGRVREVWKHWAPPFSTLESWAAELAAGAAAQGRFFDLLDRVTALEPTGQRLQRAELEAIARRAGVDLARLAHEQKALKAAVERDSIETHPPDLRPGPLLLVNGVVLVPGRVESAIEIAEDELRRGLAERLNAP